MLDFYVGEELPDNEDSWTDGLVQYLSDEERKPFEIIVRDGKLYSQAGDRFDTTDAENVFLGKGTAIFVMDENGLFYVSKRQEVGAFHHSSLVAGHPVAAAGEIGVREGKLVSFSDQSGHYRPKPEFTKQAVECLQESGVSFVGVTQNVRDT